MNFFSHSFFTSFATVLLVASQVLALPHISSPSAPQQYDNTLRDRLGSIIALVNASGNIVARYDYDAWGNIISESGPSDFRFRWQCREYIHNLRTGLYYFRNRWYDPASARFLSKDPVGLNGGDLNLYIFCGNDPVNNKDPYGLQGMASYYNANSAELYLNSQRPQQQEFDLMVASGPAFNNNATFLSSARGANRLSITPRASSAITSLVNRLKSSLASFFGSKPCPPSGSVKDLYHYTNENAAQGISQEGLKLGGMLSSTQPQMED